MARKLDLTGLGVSPFVADILGDTPTLFTAVGAAVGSAAQIPGTQFTTVVNAGTSAVKVPLIGGEGPSGGGVLGQDYKIINVSAASIMVFAANNAAGSAVALVTSAASVAGTTGLSVAAGRTAIMFPITVSTWGVFSGASAA